MKFSVSSADLQRALVTVNGAVPTKSPQPILECFLFEKDGDTLKVVATNKEVSIVQTLAVSFESNGTEGKQRIAIPARRLLDTLRALPELPVTITSDAEFNVELTTDQGRYKMVGYDGGDYPALPDLSEARTVQTTGALVKRTIEKTGFAVSKDALRPSMMGVLFQVRPESTTTVATDGHRLVKLVLSELKASEPMDFIVPEKALAQAGKAATDEASCTIRVDNSHVEFDFGDTRVIGLLIDEAYPNYEAVIPVENEKTLTVGREAMLAAVRRVALYSSSMTHQIRLALQPDKLVISAEDIERASEAKETVLCDFDAEPMEIGFNSVYLQEVLQNVDGEDTSFEFSSPNRAGVVTPSESAEGEDLLMLIMPVMLNTYA